MIINNGFVLLSRNIIDSDVFASQKLLKIWIWCLCKASFKDKAIPLKSGKGEIIIKIKRGQFLFGRNMAEDELFIDGSTIYKSMKKLQEMGMINIESNNQYSIITICNYDCYQSAENYQVTTFDQPNHNLSSTFDQPSNTYNNVNNVKKEKENENYFFENDDNKFSNFEKIEYLTKVQDLLKAEFVNVSIDIIQQEARLYVAKRLTSTDTCKSFHEYADHFYNTVKSKYKKNATNKQSFTQKTEAIEGLKEGEYIHTQWVD